MTRSTQTHTRKLHVSMQASPSNSSSMVPARHSVGCTGRKRARVDLEQCQAQAAAAEAPDSAARTQPSALRRAVKFSQASKQHDGPSTPVQAFTRIVEEALEAASSAPGTLWHSGKRCQAIMRSADVARGVLGLITDLRQRIEAISVENEGEAPSKRRRTLSESPSRRKSRGVPALLCGGGPGWRFDQAHLELVQFIERVLQAGIAYMEDQAGSSVDAGQNPGPLSAQPSTAARGKSSTAKSFQCDSNIAKMGEARQSTAAAPQNQTDDDANQWSDSTVETDGPEEQDLESESTSPSASSREFRDGSTRGSPPLLASSPKAAVAVGVSVEEVKAPQFAGTHSSASSAQQDQDIGMASQGGAD